MLQTTAHKLYTSQLTLGKHLCSLFGRFATATRGMKKGVSLEAHHAFLKVSLALLLDHKAQRR